MKKIAIVFTPLLFISFVFVKAQNVFPSSGSVGIGTTSPAFLLDVRGGAQFTGTSFINTGLQVAGNPSSWPAGQGIQLAYTGSIGYLTSYDNTALQFMPLQLRGSDITFQTYGKVFNTGNWVIGSNLVDAGYKLSVNGGSYFSGAMRFAGLTSDNTQTKVVVGDVNGNLFYRDASTLGGSGAGWSLSGNAAVNPTTTFLGTTDNTPLTFRTNNLEQIRINGTTGNVG